MLKTIRKGLGLDIKMAQLTRFRIDMLNNFRYIRAIQKSIIQNPFDSKYVKI